MTPATELAQYLADNGIGLRGGDAQWGIHVSREPIAPADVVTLYDTGGPAPPAIDIKLREHTIQVRVRSESYASGIIVQEDILHLFVQADAVINGTQLERDIGQHRYIGIWLAGEVTPIGRDDKDRFLFTANYRIQRQPLEVP